MNNRWAAFFLVLLFGVMVGAPGHCAGARQRKLFIVHSYEPGNICGQPQEKGLLAALERRGWREGKNLQVVRFYMDTKRTHIQPDQIRRQGQLARAAIGRFRPDVVVTLDDNAAREVMLPLVDTGLPVVFSGINTPPETYNQQRRFMTSRQHPGHNVTGVVEKLHAAKAMQVMREILPDLERVVLVVDESPTGRAIHAQLKRELASGTDGLLYIFRTARDFSDYKRIVRQIDSDDTIQAWYPACSLLRDGPGRVMTVPEILAWSLSHCRKPGMAASYDFVRMGLLGGASVDFSDMGSRAGVKVAAILAGTPAGVLPVEDATGYALVFNLARARQLGILIPPDLLGAADRVYESMALGGQPATLKLLVIHSAGSQDEDAALTRGFLDGLAQGVWGKRDQVRILHLFLHLETLGGGQELERACLDLQARAEGLDPDLIVVFGDGALSGLLPWLLRARTPVIFGGVHAPAVYYRSLASNLGLRFPSANMSGVISPYQLQTSLAAMRVLVPGVGDIVLVTLETWPWMRAIGDSFARARLAVRLRRTVSLDGFQQALLETNQDNQVKALGVLLPFAPVQGKDGLMMRKELVSWIMHHLGKPSLAFSQELVRHGMMLGTAMDGEQIGHRLASQVRAILDGHQVLSLAGKDVGAENLYLNQAAAQALGQDIPLGLYETATQVFTRTETEPQP